MNDQKTPKIVESLEISNSSNISRISYTDTNGLVVRFKNGGEYLYKEVPKETFYSMAKSESAGKYLNVHIKNSFKFEKLDDKNITQMNSTSTSDAIDQNSLKTEAKE